MSVERWSWSDDPDLVAAHIERSGVVAIPTESSYGLAVGPRNREAVAAVFRLKGRAAGEALPLVVANAGQARELGVDTDDPAFRLAERVWPAALSVVVPLAAPLAATAGLRSVALRIPAHRRLRTLLIRTGPLTATSANRSGSAPLTEPAAVIELLAGTGGMLVDDGPLAGGPPSTLVRWRVDGGELEILREGAYASELLRLDHPAVGSLCDPIGEETSEAE
jgi:L-threonylcarbamoyladenylate synthase